LAEFRDAVSARSLAEMLKAPRHLLRFTAAVGAAALLTCGCQRNPTLSAVDPGPGEVGTPASAAKALELSDEQRAALKIEAVRTHSFVAESEAVGTISFDEDPGIVQAESTLLSAAANLEMSRKELMRVQSLGESNGIAPKELEGVVAARQTAAAALKAARDTVRALGKTDVEIDHVIATGHFDPNRTDGRMRWVVANVAETDSPRVRVGESVRVRVPAYPDHCYTGRISRIYATIDPNTHRLTVRAQVEDSAHELRAGMLATIVIRADEAVESPALPTTAVVRQGDGSMITWVTADRRHFTERPLSLGILDEGRYQVLAGLKVHELAVTEGGVFLSNMLEAPPSD
jgi:cobalt-zinc-cadmium efflux system membrane fusion protein